MKKKSKDRNERELTVFDKKLVTHSELEQYIGCPIYQALSFFKHQEKHQKHYKSVNSYFYCLENLKMAIDNFDDNYFEARRNSIVLYKYFKEVEQEVKIAININDRNELFIATVFPVTKDKFNYSKNKIVNDNKKYYIELYTHK